MSKTSLNIMNRRRLTNDIISDDFEWKIRNFSKVIYRTESPVFSEKNEYNVKWQLVLFCDPNALVDLALYLKDCENTEISLFFTYSIIKNDDFGCSSSTSEWYESKNTYKCGIYLMTYAEFKKKYVNNDTLQIKCNVRWSTKDIDVNILKIPDIDKHYLNEDLSKDIGFLQEDQTFSDVCLEVDGVKFWANKCILAARSSVFRAMFYSDMKEKKEDVIKIEEMMPEVMKAMLSFIYTGHVDEIEAIAAELLKAADMYDVKRLKLLSENSLAASLTVNNVMELLDIADVHNADKLRNTAINFVKSNLSDVVETPNFKNFKGSKSCLIDILKSFVVIKGVA